MKKQKEIEININHAGENQIELGQTSKGIWYFKSIIISCYSIMDGLELSDKAIDRAEEILKSKNKNVVVSGD